ncbi:hypothetical protein ACHAXS_000997 [Conticribra weissflogii]
MQLIQQYDTPSSLFTDFEDEFHNVGHMVNAFNDHMTKNYLPSWLLCLDESMNNWFNKWWCLESLIHLAMNGDKGYPIVWRMKLQEGKHRPKKSDGSWAFPSTCGGHTETAKFMLEMTHIIHGTGKVVSMDSGFCVSAGILAMHSVGTGTSEELWKILAKGCA